MDGSALPEEGSEPNTANDLEELFKDGHFGGLAKPVDTPLSKLPLTVLPVAAWPAPGAH